MELVKNNDRRTYQRIVPNDGVFVVVNKHPLPVLDISLGGLAYCADEDNDFVPFSSQLEVLIMGDTIRYVDKIPHRVVADIRLPRDEKGASKSCRRRISTQFSNLSRAQQEKLQYLFHMG